MINIQMNKNKKPIVKAKDFIDGHAYMTVCNGEIDHDQVFIANRCSGLIEGIIAFSICGNMVITTLNNQDYVEVDLDIIVNQ